MTGQDSDASLIVGSTEQTAATGYTHQQTMWHLANIDHKRWDVKADETMRFLHINGPQFFTHAWVHRGGPISTIETDMQPRIGKVSAETPIGKITVDKWIADGTVDGYLVLHRGKIVYEQYPRMRPFDKHHWWSTRKCLVGAIIGMLEDEGKVDVKQGVEHYIQKLKGTAWAGVPIIDILDMASGTAGVEVDDTGNGLNCEVEFLDEQTCIYRNDDARRLEEEGSSYESRFHLRRESEANLLGVVYDDKGIMTAAPYRVIDASHWIFEGTGLKEGDVFGRKSQHQRIPGGASGHETDKISPSSPANTKLLARGMNPDDGGGEIVIHEPSGGGAVFSVGSICWPSSVLVDEDVSKITANVVGRFVER